MLIDYLTIALVLITAFYAFWTFRMAKIMSGQLKLETQPYIAFGRDLSFNVEGEQTSFVQIRYTVENLGRVPVNYFIEESTFNDEKQNLDRISIILYPEQTMFFTTKKFTIPRVSAQYLNGKASIKIIFWAISSKEKYFNYRSFAIENTTSYFIKEDRAGKL